MPDPTDPLTLSFLRTHPDAAAKTLEQLPAANVSRFMAQIPVEYAALALEQMLPRPAASVVDLLGPEQATLVLSRLETRKAANVLRLAKEEVRKNVLQDLPSAQRKLIKSLLRYGEGLVGAWMDPNHLVVPSDSNVEDALNALRNSNQKSAHGALFVVGRDGSLRGSIPAAMLLTLDPGEPLPCAAQQTTPWIVARTPVQTAIDSNLWSNRDLLPVLDGNKRFIGSIRHADLRSALEAEVDRTDETAPSQLAPTLIEDYLHTLWTLATSLIGEYTTKPKS